jgi:hypothetical protein
VSCLYLTSVHGAQATKPFPQAPSPRLSRLPFELPSRLRNYPGVKSSQDFCGQALILPHPSDEAWPPFFLRPIEPHSRIDGLSSRTPPTSV